MSSTFSGIEILARALRAQQFAAQIVTNNIANAATRGYSRRVPILAATAYLDLTSLNSAFGPGQMGTGTRLASIDRVREEYLNTMVRSEMSSLGREQAILNALTSMQVVFPETYDTPGSGLISSMGRLFDDFAALSASPTDGGLRSSLVADATALAEYFNTASRAVKDLQVATDASIQEAISTANGLLRVIAEANEGIAKASASGITAVDLMDKRDNALADLSLQIKVDAVKMNDGSVMVVTGNGRVLVRGGEVSSLTKTTMAHEPRFSGVGIRDAMNGTVADITSEVTGGKIAGLLYARDVMAEAQLLSLDDLAGSLVTQVNNFHRAGYALDGVTTNTAFFTGTNAGDILVNSVVSADPSLLAASGIYSDGTNGDVAESLGLLEKLVMNSYVRSGNPVNNLLGTIDPTQPLGSAIHTALNGANPAASNSNSFLVAPAASGTIVINGVSINWTNGDSVQDIISKINNPALGLGVRAAFDITAQRIVVLGEGPLSVYDSAGNLTAVFQMQSRFSSMSAINNGIGPSDRPIPVFSTLASSQLNYRTVAGASGTISIAGVSVAWNSGETLATIVGNINAALAASSLSVTFSSSTQRLSIVSSGALPATSAAPVRTISVSDISGNLSEVFNMGMQSTFGAFGDRILGSVRAELEAAQGMRAQAQDAVGQLNLQSEAISKVNVDEETLRLTEYMRAYEAAVKAMAVLDEMLNVLINRMAVSGAASSTQSAISA